MFEEVVGALASSVGELGLCNCHFSCYLVIILVTDQAVVEEAWLELESGFDPLQKERTKLRDRSRKIRSTILSSCSFHSMLRSLLFVSLGGCSTPSNT